MKDKDQNDLIWFENMNPQMTHRNSSVRYYSDVPYASRRVKSTATRLFVKQLVQADI